ncbi:MAG: class I SAM-dependent methyltransferase [Alphaproteobacteria bacterium]|nr:class I SAM-dependent methyltransferase [Alphaproteobacteria bacterium]
MSQLFNRRSMMGMAGGALSAASVLSSSHAHAKLKNDFEPRGGDGIWERLPSLNLEAYDEMSTSTRKWVNGALARAAQQRANELMVKNGMKPDQQISFEDASKLLSNDPIIAMRASSWQRLQWHMWQELKREFYDNYDAYMSEMEATDKTGPGTLELNPGIEPEYTKHEIHMQPGGYTGDPFAGHLYLYGTANFYVGQNYQDQGHAALAAAVPVPADGKVRRILDAGCSCGQQVVALKRRFPDAEVWGVDIGAPMVRYAHMRAVDNGVDVNFRHALAEKTGFPDGYFDIVTSYILHHEVTEQATYEIIRETSRVLRPGGVYFPVDVYTMPSRRVLDGTPMRRIQDWITSRWNHERWWYDYQRSDFLGEMQRSGFALNMDGPEASAYAVNLSQARARQTSGRPQALGDMSGQGGQKNIMGTKI